MGLLRTSKVSNVNDFKDPVVLSMRKYNRIITVKTALIAEY